MPYTHIGAVPTRATIRSYQPLRAGQFHGYGGCHVTPSKTTIINNNYYNMGVGMSSYNCYDYNNGGCCDNGGMDKASKWMLGLGAGTSILGVILDAFGIGGSKKEADGKGGEEPAAAAKPDNSLQAQLDAAMKEIKDLKDQLGGLAKTKDTKPAETTTPAATTAPKEEVKPKTDYSKTIANGLKMICTDASGKTQDIAGTLSNVQTDANGVPQSFTLTDDKSGNAYNYEVRVGSDGTMTYECVSKNGQATIGAPNYTLEGDKLINKDGQNGFGIGIRTKASTTKAAAESEQAPAAAPTKEDEQKIANAQTLVNKAFPNASKNVTVGFKNGQVTYTYNNKEFTNFLDLGREIDPNYAKGTTAQQTRNNSDFWNRQAGYGM